MVIQLQLLENSHKTINFKVNVSSTILSLTTFFSQKRHFNIYTFEHLTYCYIFFFLPEKVYPNWSPCLMFRWFRPFVSDSVRCSELRSRPEPRVVLRGRREHPFTWCQSQSALFIAINSYLSLCQLLSLNMSWEVLDLWDERLWVDTRSLILVIGMSLLMMEQSVK